MKYFILLLLSTFTVGANIAQTINMELSTSTSEFQDADLGDMEFGDIDNDGDLDLILTGKGGPILTTIYKNDGDGNFTPTNQELIEDVYLSKVSLNDIDGDGDLDLLISGSNSSPTLSTKMYLNDGDGNFSISFSPFDALSQGDFAFGDVDADGDDDIILMGLGADGSAITKLYLNDGDGNFSQSITSTIEALKNGALELFDMDGDDDLDLVIQGQNDANNTITTLYSNDGNGVFSAVSNTGFVQLSSGDIAVGDYDGDGDEDILICGNLTSSDIETKLYANDGFGNFSLVDNTIIADVSLGEVSFNDFDNDGDEDIFIIGTSEGGLPNIFAHIYQNNGLGDFTLADELIGGYFSSHAVGDIDGDNDLDLILGGTTIETPARATWLYTNETLISDVDNLSLSSKISFYPNPTTGTLKIDRLKATDATIDIYNTLGQLVYSNVLNTANAVLELNLPTGVYMITLESDDRLTTEKLVIE